MIEKYARALKERKEENSRKIVRIRQGKSILIYESSLWLKEKRNGSNNVI